MTEECFGNYSKCKDRADCVYSESCKYSESSAEQIKKEDIHSQYENVEFNPEKGDEENYHDADFIEFDHHAEIKNGNFCYTSKSGNRKEINFADLPADFIEIWSQYCIDHPVPAKAFIEKAFKKANNLSSIAKSFGMSRQLLHLKLARELGVGEKKVPEAKLVKLCSKREIDVYRCIHIEKKSFRTTCKNLGLHLLQVQRCIRDLRSKGIKVVYANKPPKIKKQEIFKLSAD